MPPFTDTVLGVDSPYRRALYSQGFVLRADTMVSYSQNTLNPPVPAAQQAYVGERPFWVLMASPMLTYDMRAFHLHGAQLNIGALLGWVTWGPAGPSAANFSNLYFFKSFAEGRVEAKFGYIDNEFEFLGLQVGGALTTGALGVYAILPFEVGLGHSPVPSPSFNLKLNGPKQLYFKGAVQRSIDPGGGPATIARNATALRFLVKGDKMVNGYEVGYNHPPWPPRMNPGCAPVTSTTPRPFLTAGPASQPRATPAPTSWPTISSCKAIALAPTRESTPAPPPLATPLI